MKGRFSSKLSNFLGDISYPLYIIHYPFIYTFMAWVVNNKNFLTGTSPNAPIVLVLIAMLVLVGSIIIAYACVKLYDVPVRKWLMKRYMKSSAK